MSEIYFDLLIVICFGLFSWGIIRIERIYQYPFFMGLIFISFLVPQGFAIINNPGGVSQNALERVFFVSCLCAVACWLGYEKKPNSQWLAKLDIKLDEKKLSQIGIFFTAQGHFFGFLLSRLQIQTASNGNWQGPATIYLFFAQVIYIAFAIFLLQTLKKPNIFNFICLAISGWPLIETVLEGRRQPTMTFIIIVGFSLWLTYRYVPPRWLIIGSTVVLMFIIPLLGALRSGFWDLVFSGNWQEILSASQTAFESQQSGDILELRTAALFMDAAEQTGSYGYGTGWWDAIVFQYVPGQIVGYEFKESLQFKWLRPEILENIYGYYLPNGTTYTGVGDSFMEFSFFGFLIFAIIAYLFKNLWVSAVYHQSMVSKLLYMGLVSPAMLGLTHGIARFLQEALFQVSFVGLLVYYSQDKNTILEITQEQPEV